MPDDPEIHNSIEDLVAEEHELWRRESEGVATEDDRRRLDQVKVALDRCWDLLRQRRALRGRGPRPGRGTGAERRRRRAIRAVALA
jgi:Protein of unknown function (DUF2630)